MCGMEHLSPNILESDIYFLVCVLWLADTMFFVGQTSSPKKQKQDPPNPALNSRPAGPESSGNELREAHKTWLPAGGIFTTDVSLPWS